MDTKYSAVLVDDEPETLENLERLLKVTGQVQVVAKESKPNMGLRQIVVYRPDIVFLDVEMPEKDGISLLKEINELKMQVRVVMMASRDHFIFEAFKNNAADFILKPLRVNDLYAVIKRFQSVGNSAVKRSENMQNQEYEKLLFPAGKKTLLVKKEQILYLKADGNYSQLITSDGGEYLITSGLGNIEKRLSDCFFRISRSVIINTEYLSALLRGKKMCMLTNGQKEYQVKASSQPFYELEARYC